VSLRRNLLTPIQIDRHEHSVSLSVGICLDSDDATAETLLNDADAATYSVKSHGGNGHMFYDPSRRPAPGHGRT
jgi:GGDEF domain-containing protein